MSSKDDSHYDYVPSVPAAVITVLAFIILLIVHVFRIFKTRTWFCTPFVVGTILEIIGYLARAYGKKKPTSTPAYIIQALFILLAPILFAASIYMFLSRMIRATGQTSFSIIKPRKLTRIFVGGDILCFIVQAIGGAILAGSDTKSASNLGKAVILAGLVLQIFIFGFFLVVAVVWHSRMKREKMDLDWERYIWMLYIVSAIISVRNLFRVIEYAMGKDGYLLANEWPMYVFDALLMVVVLALCSSWYVGDIGDGSACMREEGGGLVPTDVELGRTNGRAGTR
ncbi:RTA1-domain-containing protein [Lentithecium fluviatile CBS 122367]|uniref:RTA1-domain-containing protein n=1 Tax=Lentithecium fluviatile CBS 122367 TaxID=1168545 RepID=A0A6G1IJE7_9PLEO|nr:RTA1-domain-containing protein [Lentithecium fluviatile CBS 122367]